MDFATILGFINPIKWIEKGVASYRKPKLRIDFVIGETNITVRLADLDNVLGHFMHLMVTNTGIELARSCTARLIKLQMLGEDGEFKSHPDFNSPFVLKWAHQPDLGPRDIEPDLPRRLDLCLGIQSRPQLFSFVTDRTPSGNRFDYEPGTYKVIIRVRSENAKTVDATFLVIYRGVWDKFEIKRV